MTVEAAIKSIDDVLNSDYHYDESLGYQLTSDDIEWLEKSKKALEKQIPKKPVLIVGDYDLPVCPECKQMIDDTESYCSTCGQALDWSDAE